MNELLIHIKSISEQLNGLTTHANGDKGEEFSTGGDVSMPWTTLESLKQSVTDTLRLFVSESGHPRDDLDDLDEQDVEDVQDQGVDDADVHQPTTPPLDIDGGSTACESESDAHNAKGKNRAHGTVSESPKKRRKTTALPQKNSTRVAEKYLPDCLRNLELPSISDYKKFKIGSFMAANIMVMNLQKLQPKAEVVAMISRGSVLLLHEALCAAPELLDTSMKNNIGGLASLTAASFWILAKFGGFRALTPDATLMSMAAGVCKEQLFAAEMMIMEALKWDVVAPLRLHNHFDALVL